MEDIIMNYAEQIVKWREEHKLTQEDMSNTLKISLSSIKRWERGRPITKIGLQLLKYKKIIK